MDLKKSGSTHNFHTLHNQLLGCWSATANTTVTQTHTTLHTYLSPIVVLLETIRTGLDTNVIPTGAVTNLLGGTSRPRKNWIQSGDTRGTAPYCAVPWAFEVKKDISGIPETPSEATHGSAFILRCIKE